MLLSLIAFTVDVQADKWINFKKGEEKRLSMTEKHGIRHGGQRKRIMYVRFGKDGKLRITLDLLRNNWS